VGINAKFNLLNGESVNSFRAEMIDLFVKPPDVKRSFISFSNKV